MSVSEALHCGSPGQPVLSGIFIAPLGLGLLRLMAHTSPAEFLLVSCVQCAICLVKTLGHCRTKC